MRKLSGEIMKKILVILGILLFINMIVISLSKAFALSFADVVSYQVSVGNNL